MNWTKYLETCIDKNSKRESWAGIEGPIVLEVESKFQEFHIGGLREGKTERFCSYLEKKETIFIS